MLKIHPTYDPNRKFLIQQISVDRHYQSHPFNIIRFFCIIERQPTLTYTISSYLKYLIQKEKKEYVLKM